VDKRADYEVGTLESKIELEVNGAVKSIQNLVGSLNTLKTTLKSTINSTNNNKLNDSFEKTAKTIKGIKNAMNFGALYIGLKKGWDIAKDLGSSYINLVEINNLFEVSLGKVVDQYGNLDEAQSKYYVKALAFQNEMNEKLATNKAEMKEYQAMYFSMFKSQGINLDASYLMSESLTKAGYDIASLYNLNVEDAMNKLKSGIAGQVEPLRKIGIDISESSLQKVLGDVGIDKKVQQLSYAEKQVARYIAIVNQAKQAQGDFAKTFETPANQIRIFKNQLIELKQVAGSFIINTFGNVITYANAIIMVIKEILKAFANLFGYDLDSSGVDLSDSTGVEDFNNGLIDANKKVKELKKQLMGFDEINNISPPSSNNGSSDSGNPIGVDSKLLENLKEWDNKMSGISGKAQSIRDKMLEWLGFERNDDNTWKLGEGLTNFDKIKDTIGLIGIAFGTWKVSSTITDVLDKLNVLSKTQAFQIAFGLTLLLTGLFAQYKGTKHLLEGDVDLFTILETLVGTTAGTFGIVSLLSATKLGKTLPLPHLIGISAGIMLTIQGIQVFADGIKNDDWAKKLVGALEAGTSTGVVVGLVGKSWQLGVKAGLIVTIGSISFASGWSIGEWLKENYGESITWYIKKFKLDLDKDGVIVGAVKIAGVILGTIGDAIIDGYWTLCNAIADAIWWVVDSISKWWKESKIKKIGEEIINGIIAGIKSAGEFLYDKLIEPIKTAIDKFKEFLGIHSPSTVFEGFGKNIIEGLISGLVGKIEDLKTKITGMASNVGQWFSEKISNISDKGKEIVNKIGKGISDTAQNIKTKAQELGTNTKKWFADKISNISDKGKEVVSKITTGIKEKASSLKTKVQDLGGNVKSWFGNKISSIKDKGKEIVDKIKSGFSGNTSNLKNKIKEVGGKVKSWFSDKVGDMNSVGSNIVEGVKKRNKFCIRGIKIKD